MSAYDGHAVRWSCAKCGQEHVLKESDVLEEAVVPVGQKGKPVQSNTEEIFTITSRSTRRDSDAQGSPTVRSGGWFVTVLGTRQGPMNDYGLMELLAAGKINARTYIWRSPMTTWVRMKDLKEVEGLLAQAAAGAAARRDSGSWPPRETAPGIEIQTEPPREPSPWDSRITGRPGQDEQTGRHGIKATPISGTTGRADELYQDLENPTMDPRKADAVPLADDDDRPSPGEYWHSPEPRREEPRIRESKDSFGSEITQPGKRTQRRRTQDRRKPILIAVVASVVAIAAIVLATVLIMESRDGDGKGSGKSNAAAVARARVDTPAPKPTPAPVPAPEPAPAPAPVPAPPPTPSPAPIHDRDVEEKKDIADGESVSPVPVGPFDENELTLFVQEQVPGFSTCRKMMARKVETSIKVNLRFTVGTSGDIQTLVITPIDITDPALNVCMQTLVSKWNFPRIPRPVSFNGTVVIP